MNYVHAYKLFCTCFLFDYVPYLFACSYQVIEDLEQLSSLTYLHLYGDKIRAITGLNHLVKLEKLWLNGNKIREIKVWCL